MLHGVEHPADSSSRYPVRGKLAEHAQHVGLPLPEHLIAPVVARIRRRQRGMAIGGTTGIVVATLIYIIFFDNDDGAVGFLVMFVAAMGTAFGGAWAITAHRTSQQVARPVVVRMRSVQLRDYLTKGERFGLWSIPAVLLIGTLAGIIMLVQLPAESFTQRSVTAGVVAALALATWGLSLIALRKVLAAPARSESDLELAWDDAEHADGLRQVVNLSVIVACTSLLFWLMFIFDAVTADGFYRQYENLAMVMSVTALVVYGALFITVVAGPFRAWAGGTRRGYEQRQLWAGGVAS